MDIDYLTKRQHTMASNVSVNGQNLEGRTAATRTRNPQSSEPKTGDYYTQGQMDLKEVELAIYYKHTNNLQHCLDQSNESLALAQRQLQDANELNSASLRCLEEYKMLCATLKSQLDGRQDKDKAQEKHANPTLRSSADNPRGR